MFWFNYSDKGRAKNGYNNLQSNFKCSPLKWVTVVVKLEDNEDGGANVHFEAFQMSDMCVKLFKEGWFVTEFGEEDDPKLSKLKKEVVVGVKDVKEVDNDFFLWWLRFSTTSGLFHQLFPSRIGTTW